MSAKYSNLVVFSTVAGRPSHHIQLIRQHTGVHSLRRGLDIMKAADPLKEYDKPSEFADSSAQVSDTQVTLATAKVRTHIMPPSSNIL